LSGLAIDKVIELMAKKYGEAGDKALFLNGVSGAFGDKIGPKLIDVFQRINSEGLNKFTAGAQKAAEGMLALAKMSDFTDRFQDKLLHFSASGVGALQDFADIADAVALALQGIIPPKDIFKVAQSLGDMIKAQEAAAAADVGNGGDSALTSTPEENKWYTLMEKKLLGRKNLTEKIAYYEQEITALQKARAENPSDLIIATQVLEIEEKRDALKKAFNKRDYEESVKLDATYKAQDELAVDFAKKREDLMSGKGIETPSRARVDSLQAIGGIIGGVAGRGDQAARIAERQAKSTEAIETLMRETNGKLDELNRKMDGIISE
jgi:hypothetical protein